MAARRHQPLRTKGSAWGPKRVKLGISMRELERRSGISRGMLALAEAGRLVPTAREYESVDKVLREQEEAASGADGETSAAVATSP